MTDLSVYLATSASFVLLPCVFSSFFPPSPPPPPFPFRFVQLFDDSLLQHSGGFSYFMCAASCFFVLCNDMLCCVVLCCDVMYCVVLCWAMLWCVVLFCVLLLSIFVMLHWVTFVDRISLYLKETSSSSYGYFDFRISSAGTLNTTVFNTVQADAWGTEAVSYTHLTLPTNHRV